MLSKDHLEIIQGSKEKVLKHLIIVKDNFTSSIQTGAARVHDNIETIISDYICLSFYLSIPRLVLPSLKVSTSPGTLDLLHLALLWLSFLPCCSVPPLYAGG